MLKKILTLFIVLLFVITIISCSSNDIPNNDVNNVNTDDNDDSTYVGNTDAQNEDPTSTDVQGNSISKTDEEWPSEMLPEDFPNLGKVTKVYDSRSFVKKITINWRIVTKDEVEGFVKKLNEYLDYDHAWQGGFYSDGIKYKTGTEDEFINIIIRYQPTATGNMEPEFDPQFILEISGDGITDKK